MTDFRHAFAARNVADRPLGRLREHMSRYSEIMPTGLHQWHLRIKDNLWYVSNADGAMIGLPESYEAAHIAATCPAAIGEVLAYVSELEFAALQAHNALLARENAFLNEDTPEGLIKAQAMKEARHALQAHYTKVVQETEPGARPHAA